MNNFILPILALLSILFVIFYAGSTVGYSKALKKCYKWHEFEEEKYKKLKTENENLKQEIQELNLKLDDILEQF